MLLTAILVVPFGSALACLLARPRIVAELLNVAGFVAILALGVRLAAIVAADASGACTAWDGFLRADALSAWMVILIAVVSLAGSIYAAPYFRRDLADNRVTERRVREFYVLTPLCAGGMLAAVLVDNLGVMWIAVEAMALSSVFLVALYNRETSLEAAWKYVTLGSLGLVLALFGTIFTYAAAIGRTGVMAPSFEWSRLLAMAPQLDHHLMRLAFVFVLVGYGTKAGLAPMHTWLPDAHSEAPSPTSAMLSGVSLKIGVYALLRFHILTSACLGSHFSARLLLGFGMVSMVIAGPFILVQTNLKRLLAYSSLEHVGLVCVGVGMNAPLTTLGAILHMGYHALTKPVLFFAAGNVHQHAQTLEFRRLGGGLIRAMPITVPLLCLGAVAVSGLPPFGLFVSELTVLGGGATSGNLWVSVVMLSALILVFCGMLSKLAGLVLGPGGVQGPRETVSAVRIAAMGLPLAALLAFTIWVPAALRVLIAHAASIVRGSP